MFTKIHIFFSKLLFPLFYSISNLMNMIKPLSIYSEEETIQKLQQGYSFSRYGDGELQICVGRGGAGGFQRCDPEITNALNQILAMDTKSNPGFIVGLISTLGSFKGYNLRQKKFYATYNLTRRNAILKLLYNEGRGQQYGDPVCVRVWGFHHDTKDTLYKKIEDLNKIWQEKNVLVVEGPSVKLGINTDVLYSAKSVSRIIVPAKEAFDKRKEIFDAVVHQKDFDLVLLACGPTATVLAYDIYKTGKQAIDFGQMQTDYIKKSLEFDGFHHEVMPESKYKEQIVSRIL